MTMTPEFTRGTHLRAADLNRLASEAASAHPGFNGFLAADNGAGLSLRSPRRDPARGGGTWKGAAPLIASVNSVTPSAVHARCTTLDGRDAGTLFVAAIELAGGEGTGGGPYRVVAYPHVAHVAAIDEEVPE